MCKYPAHSARGSIPEQPYCRHVENVYNRARRFAREAEEHSACCNGALISCVSNASALHDFGKLAEQNRQALLRPRGQSHLPINHVDAGTAALLSYGDIFAAIAVYAHHRGLPDMPSEDARGEEALRDANPAVRAVADEQLPRLRELHDSLTKAPLLSPVEYKGDVSIFLRMVLSCLVDADHSDTAENYRQYPGHVDIPPLRAKERLDALNTYIAGLGGTDARSRLRNEMYQSCRDADISSGISACDSPVGSGKTTAVMAHLLRQAELRKARRIFVILPYTSIITQSVEVYRKHLVLPGEEPEAVVAELHSRADFEDADVRYLSALWRAPIVVTTAVAFFETLASAYPSALRKLHELPGSVLFLDEAHAALPLHLLPLSWRWMRSLASEWGCYWVLASGSLVRFWNIHELIADQYHVPDLIPIDLRQRLMRYESGRVAFAWEPQPLCTAELIRRVHTAPGPRLLILNTVQNAAVLADAIRRTCGRERVEHLSAALTPKDRAAAIGRIKARLADPGDTDWTLVATSCVEAGVDFSFRTGFREVSSLLSLLQCAGRVSRHGEADDAKVYSFTLQDDSRLNRNPAMEVSAKVLKGYLSSRRDITPELSTHSMRDALTLNDSAVKALHNLTEFEEAGRFHSVCDSFQVIDDRTVTAVADAELVQRIRSGQGDWRELQMKSVAVPKKQVKDWKLKEIAPDLYAWTLPYDPFLGYMAGVLSIR